MKTYNVCIVGATGAVGEEISMLLEERGFPVKKLFPFASSRSIGKTVRFRNAEIPVIELSANVFAEHKIDIAFFSAGGNVSAEFVPHATKAGAVVIDNTSYFRMHERVPLVVPDVNPKDISLYKQMGIIANPNCSTIQMSCVLAPLHRRFQITRVDVSTYQAVSGAGKSGMEELIEQNRRFFDFTLSECEARVFAHQIAFNAIPHIDVFFDDGYTKEEVKMIQETHKILHADFPISATCVRIPVLRSHSESISITFSQQPDIKSVCDVLQNAPAVVVYDDPKQNIYPMPILASEKDETFVGRIRKDRFNPHIIHLWCVADQIRVGAATNAVKIAEKWIGLQ